MRACIECKPASHRSHCSSTCLDPAHSQLHPRKLSAINQSHVRSMRAEPSYLITCPFQSETAPRQAARKEEGLSRSFCARQHSKSRLEASRTSKTACWWTHATYFAANMLNHQAKSYPPSLISQSQGHILYICDVHFPSCVEGEISLRAQRPSS